MHKRLWGHAQDLAATEGHQGRVTFPEAPRVGPGARGVAGLVQGGRGLQRKCQVEPVHLEGFLW